MVCRKCAAKEKEGTDGKGEKEGHRTRTHVRVRAGVRRRWVLQQWLLLILLLPRPRRPSKLVEQAKRRRGDPLGPGGGTFIVIG